LDNLADVEFVQDVTFEEVLCRWRRPYSFNLISKQKHKQKNFVWAVDTQD
jgi:hypothetical protein